ncbi:MAG TPA: acyl-CoA dehydrogenase family protein [Kofleriaceae bacterium]|nr:acyl-CoA dehydrogenase family protein [Kofleriaceae bacterium]
MVLLPADLDERPIDRAVRGGYDADRVGAAFVAGYSGALRTLVPGAPMRTSLCATESGGAHPKAIQTRLDADGRLVGHKRWSTYATEAELLLVVATIGVDDAGRNRLKLVRVAPGAPGVTITPMPPPPFAPEVAHAEVVLDTRVSPGDILPGDGYTEYLKPFRTIEDIHVHGAMLGWMLGLAARHGWPRELAERLLAAVAALRTLAAAPPLAPATHLALAGAIATTRELVERAPWSTLDPDAHARWQRDRPLLEVAGKARAARLEAAWQAQALAQG